MKTIVQFNIPFTEVDSVNLHVSQRLLITDQNELQSREWRKQISAK